MKVNNKNAQLEILNRFSYMLDEYSVQYLAARDVTFRQVVEDLYKTVDHQAETILANSA